MAVQAQYPSHLLHLHRNNTDCSLQLQSQALVADQPSDKILFGDYPVVNGGTNARKTIDLDDMNLFHQQQQQQFCSQNVDVSTGLRLAFHDQQKLQQHCFSSQCSVFSSSEEFLSQINQQRDEIDQFLHSQGEELRRMLANRRQIHYHALLRAAEESMSNRMRGKHAEAEKARRRNVELEARAAHLSAEAQVWQARARAHEAEAATLQSQLQEAIMRRSVGNGLAEREEVGLRCASGDVDDAESAYIDPERVVLTSGPGCKACGKRVASVVLLPCRHLCVCTECDGVVSSCPSCLSFRSSSIEVYLS